MKHNIAIYYNIKMINNNKINYHPKTHANVISEAPYAWACHILKSIMLN